MDRVRVLAMDHFFEQDLKALSSHPQLDVRSFPYQRLRGPALRIMGGAAADGLPAYKRPALEPARQRYAAWLTAEVRRLYLERAFDVLVLPSDTFFYVRVMPDAAHAFGLPVVVVQKETTISTDTMKAHSLEVGDAAPFAADFMTVCSERHRQFWLRAGAAEDRVEVTGQPRFDMYASRVPPGRRTRRRVLFLSYELDAYVPGVGQGMGLRTWEPLRVATERVLFDAVHRGDCEVVVKYHPQQNYRVEATALSRRAGRLWNRGLRVAPLDADTRDLIVTADVVVGFQTTALYEAVAAGKAVVYAAWGDQFEQLISGLIPFHEAPAGCVRHATSPAVLAQLLSAQPAAPAAGCEEWYEEALGPVDGQATERVASRLATIAAQWPSTEERRVLDRHRRRYAVGLLARSVAAEAVWSVAGPVARVSGQRTRVDRRRRSAGEARALAAATLRGGDGPDVTRDAG